MQIPLLHGNEKEAVIQRHSKGMTLGTCVAAGGRACSWLMKYKFSTSLLINPGKKLILFGMYCYNLKKCGQ